ncbi:MAG: 50S ribosomal protein L22 [Candidatus Moranbacteria bacterium]|nr:50S ribosomal protein L22 [Candidatus Moranbacteria bacterium]
MKVSAKLNNLRIAPRKMGLVAELIRGLDVDDALVQLDARVKGGCESIKKLLLSAISNAENNFGIDRDNMFVSSITVGGGPTIKRWMPRAYGRAAMIRKRTSNIELIVDERIEGKGRKTKEQLEQERKARMEEKSKREKEAAKKTDERKESTAKVEDTKEIEKVKKETFQGKWTNRIFRRKSM